MAKVSQAQALRDWVLKHPELAASLGYLRQVRRPDSLESFGAMADRLAEVTETSRDVFSGDILLGNGQEIEKISHSQLVAAKSLTQLLITAGSCLAARAAIRRGFVR